MTSTRSSALHPHLPASCFPGDPAWASHSGKDLSPSWAPSSFSQEPSPLLQRPLSLSAGSFPSASNILTFLPCSLDATSPLAATQFLCLLSQQNNLKNCMCSVSPTPCSYFFLILTFIIHQRCSCQSHQALKSPVLSPFTWPLSRTWHGWSYRLDTLASLRFHGSLLSQFSFHLTPQSFQSPSVPSLWSQRVVVISVFFSLCFSIYLHSFDDLICPKILSAKHSQIHTCSSLSFPYSRLTYPASPICLHLSSQTQLSFFSFLPAAFPVSVRWQPSSCSGLGVSLTLHFLSHTTSNLSRKPSALPSEYI